MGDKERVLDKIHLENGLTVYFVDQSRPLTGGRFQVRLLIRAPLQIQADYFADSPDPLHAMRECAALAVNSPLEFRTEKVRNFIAEELVPEILEQMKADFIHTGLEYLKRPNFPGNFVRKRCAELGREHAVHMARERALKEAEADE
ncbi:MAG: hypothetical protein LLG06_20635 [Desulfobacteraceae bacterium]|nr:hypothetical protein [Desulfobacteraceae bacterium]